MKSFLTESEERDVVAAIREQELRTSAEIRVCVTNRIAFRPERFAWKLFDRIGMRETKNRNAALIVLMPAVRQVVIIGDKGFDQVVPPHFWRDSVDAMISEMHEHGPVAALHAGLKRLGDKLSVHWPRLDDDVNELPDEIVRG